MESKTIKINKDFLKLKNNKTSKNKTNKQKPTIDKKTQNEINKNKILNLSKMLALNEKDNEKKIDNNEKEKTDENNNLLDFFEKLNLKRNKKNKKVKQNKTTIDDNKSNVDDNKSTIDDNKSNVDDNNKSNVDDNKSNIDDNNISDIKKQLNKTPKWGCLKGGKLPTKPKINKTIKINQNNENNENKNKISIHQDLDNKNLNKNKDNEPNLRENKLNEIKTKIKNDTFKVNKTIKTHLLGKRNGKLSVLLKNNKTIKKIKKDLKQALNQDMNKINTYLKEKNLIKVGSVAPDEIKKKIYEEAILTGDVKNVNKDNLIYNFMNEKN